MRARPEYWLPVVLAVLMLAALTSVLLLLLTPVQTGFERRPELETIGVVVTAVGFLLVILFVMTVAFKWLGLANPAEALGLPAGSVRALIALLFLLLFAFFSVFLFGAFITPRTQTLSGVTQEQLAALGERAVSFTQQRGSDLFLVRVAVPLSEATERFAQQIFTAMLTLVTAVSSFYFASRTAETGVPKAPSAELAITKVEPESEAASKGVVPMAIEGRGFAAPASVQLRRRDHHPIDASLVQVVDPTKIKCQIDVSKAEKGDWSVVVRNPDGREAARDAGFGIT